MEARVAKLEATAEHIGRDIGDFRADVRREFAEIRAEMRREFSEQRLDVREIKRDMRTDFRLLFGAIITVALGMSGLMAKGFHWL